MQIVIHRGAHEVGGSCVELSHDGTTILLDVGLPLDCDMDEDLESHLPQSAAKPIKTSFAAAS